MSRDFILVFGGGMVSLVTTLVVLFIADFLYRRAEAKQTRTLSSSPLTKPVASPQPVEPAVPPQAARPVASPQPVEPAVPPRPVEPAAPLQPAKPVVPPAPAKPVAPPQPAAVPPPPETMGRSAKEDFME